MENNDQNEQWRQRILDYQESGLTMKSWCTAKGVPFHQLKYWIRKLSLSTRQRSSPTWVTVTPTPNPSTEESTLIVRVGGASIDIRPGFDPSLLAQVVQALETRS